MNLWFSCSLLVAGLFVSISAEASECQTVAPLPLASGSKMLGRLNLIMGYVDSEEYRAIMKSLDSSWMNVSASNNTDEVIMYEESKINGKCFSSSFRTAIDGDTATSAVGNITTVFHMLPSCEGCVVFSGNSTNRNLEKYLDAVNLDSTNTREHFTTRVLYLMAREDTIKDSDLEDFKRLASCLGFPGEPDFIHDTKKGFCEEGEGVKMMIS
ncbi:uncharacterized protein [Chaetodon trifascialis]|uniref:uncharacterized protein n=1 Tax=Chaetodon trifascialis TaxID=109706 RepID=UPI0039923019